MQIIVKTLNNRATENNTKDYKSVPQGHKKTPIS